MSWVDGITDSMDMSLSCCKDREAWRATVHGVAKSWTQFYTTEQQSLHILYKENHTICSLWCLVFFHLA